ncbi:MAG: addiction module antidote protein, HigA family [Flavobacterium sp.]|jgi:addiction module HigA family antidote|nr:MAG: addiction module antidote protein, HigA family [Flavobacterium sp.]
MEASLEQFKGIHPGMILERELKKRKLKKGPFALSLQIYPQTINEITKGRRGLTPAMALRIDEALGLEDGTMLVLQAYHEIKLEKEKRIKNHPNLDLFRKILFWDTDIEKIDWNKQASSIIKRIFERGNDKEKREITLFYGKEKIKQVTGKSTIKNNSIPVMSNHNIK